MAGGTEYGQAPALTHARASWLHSGGDKGFFGKAARYPAGEKVSLQRIRRDLPDNSFKVLPVDAALDEFAQARITNPALQKLYIFC